jgi:thiol-disulfide isomerase/thioredoxin
MMKKNLLIQGAVLSLVAVGFGFLGGKLGQQHNSSEHALATVPNTVQQQGGQTIQSQLVQPPEVAGATFKGLNPIDSKWIQTFLGTKVRNSADESVSIPTNKPILVVAPWCTYCHQSIQLLSQNGLMDKVQVVGAAFNYSETSKKNTLNVTTVSQGEDLMQKALAQEKVSLSSDKMLYALPSDGLDKQLPAFPLLLVPHDGKWYMQEGFYPGVSQWKQVLF